MSELADSDDFDIIYRKGGIFDKEGAPAHAEAATYTHVKRNPKSRIVTVSTNHRAAGTEPFLPVKRQELVAADHIATIERLLELLRGLPTQYPRADAEDLYGRNASLMRVMSVGAYVDFIRDQWDIPRPTEEQKAMFDEAASIIEEWAA